MFSLQIFAGNFDRNSIVVHEMLPPFYASMVKIPPSVLLWMDEHARRVVWLSHKGEKSV